MPRGMLGKGAPAAGAPFTLTGRITLAGGLRLLCAALCILAGTAASADGSCRADRIDAHAHARYVFDGDTVRIGGAERVRFIGVNAPELAHDGNPPQAYAEQARKRLRELLRRHHYRIALRYDSERRDRYRRLLAHVYLENGASVEAWLLEQGLATTLAVPPNLWNVDCYLGAERRARTARRGIWSLPEYQPLDSRRLRPGTRGYHLVRGRVVRVGRSRKSVWLNLDGGVALRIDRRELHYFKALNLTTLKGKTVLARGWLHPYQGTTRIRIRHPAALQVISTPATL